MIGRMNPAQLIRCIDGPFAGQDVLIQRFEDDDGHAVFTVPLTWAETEGKGVWYAAKQDAAGRWTGTVI